MAASGGVSLIIQESNLFNNSPSATWKLFCDVGNIASVETIDSNTSKVYGYKGFLYSPSYLIKGCLDDLPNILAKLETQSLPLFLDCILPHERLLYNSSPCRHLTLTERVNFNPASSVHFGGAYPEQISDKSSEAEDDQPAVLRHSIGLPEISVKTPKNETRKSQKLPMDHIINRKLSFNDLYDEIDKKIKKNKYSLLELSAMEENSYGQAGITITDSRNRSCSYDGDFSVNSDESPPNSSKRLQSARPALLKIKVDPLPREDLIYMNYLGKIPEI